MQKFQTYLKTIPRVNIRFAGMGGQGIILMAYIYGKAAIYDKRLNAVQTQKYGPESRGTPVKSDLVLSNKPIRFPLFREIDVFVCLSQESYTIYHHKVNPAGIIIFDSSMIKNTYENPRIFGIPATSMAHETLGNKMAANTIMLGYLNKVMDSYVSDEAVEHAIRDSLRPRLIDLNLKAYRIGRNYSCDK